MQKLMVEIKGNVLEEPVEVEKDELDALAFAKQSYAYVMPLSGRMSRTVRAELEQSGEHGEHLFAPPATVTEVGFRFDPLVCDATKAGRYVRGKDGKLEEFYAPGFDPEDEETEDGPRSHEETRKFRRDKFKKGPRN